MSMSEDEYREDAARGEYEREIEERTLAGIKENAINYYFFYYGDDVENRIRGRIEAAKALVAAGFNAESLTSSIIATELTIRWFLLRPLCEASFMSDVVAEVLVERILPKKSTGVDRQILPEVLKQWGSDVHSLKLSDGSELWAKVTNEFYPVRNAFIHRGETVEKPVAEGALDAAERLLAEAIRVVTPYKSRGKDGWGPQHVRRKLEEL